MEETLHLRGAFELYLKDPRGEIVETRRVDNVVVTAGRRWVLQQICSSLISTAQTIGFVGVGTSTTAPATGDSGLGGETLRKAINNYTTTNLSSNPPSWQAEVSFATNEANTTLAEVAMFNSSAAGTMLAHATFATVNKATSNTLSISYVLSA